MRKDVCAFALALALLLSAACGKSPIDPSPPPPPPPDQSGYPPLPLTNQFADGDVRAVRAWVTLNDVDPLRGTVVVSQVCPANVAGKWCFSYRMRVWIDPTIEDGNGPGLTFTLKFSDDGITPWGDSPYVGGHSLSSLNNRTEVEIGGNGGFYPLPFATVPKFLILEGEFRYNRNKPSGSGTEIARFPVQAAFQLDYR